MISDEIKHVTEAQSALWKDVDSIADGTLIA